jgi:hypothetical protein
MFGRVEGCDYGKFHEGIRPGQPCLYPSAKYICQPVGVGSMIELCAALEGTPMTTNQTNERLDVLGLVQISMKKD